ncbi:MAG TPA: hypothetical protein VI636_07420 [Candidatus Angelobacter sp.]
MSYRSLAESTPSAIVLDSNLMLLLLVGLLDVGRIKRFKRTQQYSESDFDLLANFLSPNRRVITTPHILTEVSNLAGQLEGILLRTFYSLYSRAVQSFEEVNRSAREVVLTDMFGSFGLTHAVIAEVGKAEVQVLTDDFPLAGFLANKGIDVMLFSTLRSLAGG